MRQHDGRETPARHPLYVIKLKTSINMLNITGMREGTHVSEMS